MLVFMSKDWTKKIFIDKPELFGVGLERAINHANDEAIGIMKIFSKFEVPKKGLILDLCCGIGRHSIILAENGFKVVGVDISPEYIARANDLAKSRNVSKNVEFIVGDMREIVKVLTDFRGKFNAVINLVTSIGYYDEETDKAVLMHLLELAATNSLLIIDITNRDWIISHFLAEATNDEGDNIIKKVERKLLLENSRMRNIWRYYRKEGNELHHLNTFELDHRIYSLHELKRLVEESGWIYKTSYGNLNLDPFIMNSNRIVLVAQKLKK
jgi:SAM-dependent methyltransferase